MSNNELWRDEIARWLGTPFHHRAAQCGVGCDCFGLVYGVLRALGRAGELKWPDYRPANAPDAHSAVNSEYFGGYFPQTAERAGGQIWLFVLDRRRFHLGLSLDARLFVHAHSNHGVMASTLGAKWQARWSRAYQIIED